MSSAGAPAAVVLKPGKCERKVVIGPTTHVVMHSWRPKAERGVELTTVLMHSKKNGRPVDTMTTFVENTESALSSGAQETTYKILKNKRDWFIKTPAAKAGGRSRGGNRRNADGQVADPVITALWLGSGRRTRSGVETNQPDEEEVRGREIERNKPRRDR